MAASLDDVVSRLVAASARLNEARAEYQRVIEEKNKVLEKYKPFHLETREVLAEAYLGPNKGRTMLSHSCEIGASGMLIRVLCGRVSPLSIADKFAQDIALEPTCKVCQARKKKWQP
jgi:hypothetical protein